MSTHLLVLELLYCTAQSIKSPQWAVCQSRHFVLGWFTKKKKKKKSAAVTNSINDGPRPIQVSRWSICDSEPACTTAGACSWAAEWNSAPRQFYDLHLLVTCHKVSGQNSPSVHGNSADATDWGGCSCSRTEPRRVKWEQFLPGRPMRYTE